MTAGEPYWLLAVLGDGDGSTPLVAIQPATQSMYDDVAIRLRRARFGRITGRDWRAGVWPVSPTSALDVVRRDLVRVTTGQASLYRVDTHPVTPMWMSAARERRALVALLPVATFDRPPATVDAGLDRLRDLADERQLLGAMAPVRFDLPVRRPAGYR